MKIREKYSLTFKYSNIKSSLCLILNSKKLLRRCFSGGNKGFVVPIRNKARLVPRLSRFFVSKQRSCKQASWLGSGLARPVCSRCKPVCTFAGPEGSRCAGTQRCRATDRATARSKLVTTEPEQHAGKRRVRYKRPRRQIVFQPAAAGNAAYLACPVRWRAHERPRQAQSSIVHSRLRGWSSASPSGPLRIVSGPARPREIISPRRIMPGNNLGNGAETKYVCTWSRTCDGTPLLDRENFQRDSRERCNYWK